MQSSFGDVKLILKKWSVSQARDNGFYCPFSRNAAFVHGVCWMHFCTGLEERMPRLKWACYLYLPERNTPRLLFYRYFFCYKHSGSYARISFVKRIQYYARKTEYFERTALLLKRTWKITSDLHRYSINGTSYLKEGNIVFVGNCILWWGIVPKLGTTMTILHQCHILWGMLHCWSILSMLQVVCLLPGLSTIQEKKHFCWPWRKFRCTCTCLLQIALLIKLKGFSVGLSMYE